MREKIKKMLFKKINFRIISLCVFSLLNISNMSYANPNTLDNISHISGNNVQASIEDNRTSHNELINQFNTHEDKYLTPEEAFHFQAYVVGKEKIVAQWVAPDGYHFYHDKFQFLTTTGVLIGEAKIDAGEKVFNKALNKTLEENKGLVNISIPIVASKPGEFEIIALSQGCAETLCYPPQKRVIKLKIN